MTLREVPQKVQILRGKMSMLTRQKERVSQMIVEETTALLHLVLTWTCVFCVLVTFYTLYSMGFSGVQRVLLRSVHREGSVLKSPGQ